MANETPHIKFVNIKDISIHPQALEAFLFSQNMTPQAKTNSLPNGIINLPNFEIPFGCIRHNRVQVFANWRTLLNDSYHDENLPVVTFNSRLSDEIIYQSWLYVLSQISFSVHKKFLLKHLHEFLTDCPDETRRRIFSCRNSSISDTSFSKFFNVPRSTFKNAKNVG